MEQDSVNERRRRSRLPAPASMEVQLWLQLSNGKWQKVPARVENFSQNGLGVLVPVELSAGQTVLVEGAPASVASGPGRPQGIIAWVTQVDKLYRAGISFEGNSATNPAAEELDYYEFLQIHPKAEPETVHRVYRIMAQRYHPDNQDTGSEQLFKALVGAYRVLADPVQRAAYDVERARIQKKQWRVFNAGSASGGMEAERDQRQAVLSMLYVKRMRDANNPGVQIQEFEELLGVPREHLDFTLWYLREQGFVVRTDNGRFAITVKGVDRAEELGATPKPASSLLRLESSVR
jgi:DnaJ-domain-containing protein 1